MSSIVTSKTLPQCLHIALTALATVHIGNRAEYISQYLWVLCFSTKQETEGQLHFDPAALLK